MNRSIMFLVLFVAQISVADQFIFKRHEEFSNGVYFTVKPTPKTYFCILPRGYSKVVTGITPFCAAGFNLILNQMRIQEPFFLDVKTNTKIKIFTLHDTGKLICSSLGFNRYIDISGNGPVFLTDLVAFATKKGALEIHQKSTLGWTTGIADQLSCQ